MTDRDKLSNRQHGGAKAVSKKEAIKKEIRHPVAETNRPEAPEVEGGPSLPEELTGRASGTGEDLTALFDNESKAHMADGFRGGSADDQPEPP